VVRKWNDPTWIRRRYDVCWPWLRTKADGGSLKPGRNTPREACQGVDVLPACRLQPKEKKNGVVFCMAPNYTRCEIKAKKKNLKPKWWENGRGPRHGASFQSARTRGHGLARMDGHFIAATKTIIFMGDAGGDNRGEGGRREP